MALPFLLLTLRPWSALGSLLHGLVLSTAVVPLLLLVFRPPRLVGLVVLATVPVALALLVYVLVTPEGFASLRAKLETGFAVCAGVVGGFVAALMVVELLDGAGDPSSLLRLGGLGFVGFLALVVAVGASLDAVVTALGRGDR